MHQSKVWVKHLINWLHMYNYMYNLIIYKLVYTYVCIQPGKP